MKQTGRHLTNCDTWLKLGGESPVFMERRQKLDAGYAGYARALLALNFARIEPEGNRAKNGVSSDRYVQDPPQRPVRLRPLGFLLGENKNPDSPCLPCRAMDEAKDSVDINPTTQEIVHQKDYFKPPHHQLAGSYH